MARQRRSRSWWSKAVSRWKRSGLRARHYARRRGLSARTLLWWSSTLNRGTRAKRESGAAIVPLEVTVAPPVRTGGGPIEVAVAGALVRIEVGTDVEYVAELVHRLRAQS